MAGSLATPDDLADMWRPLSVDEIERAQRLLVKASALLRQRAPWVDDRIALFQSDPSDRGGLNPATAATVVATMVKRFLSNTQGVASESVGPYSVSYAIRGEKDIRGELNVTDADIEALRPASTRKSRVGSIKVKADMAPWPYGRLGVAAGFAGGDPLLTGTGPVESEFPFVTGHSDES